MNIAQDHHPRQGPTPGEAGPTPVPSAEPRAWLEHFPPGRRSAISNWFHYAVRDGARDPAQVLQTVRQTCTRRRHGGNATDATMVLEALAGDPGGALAYAAAVLAYEALPPAERQRVKAERAIHFVKEAMGGKAVTPAQLAYLKALGYAGAPPTDRAQASALIDALKKQG